MCFYVLQALWLCCSVASHRLTTPTTTSLKSPPSAPSRYSSICGPPAPGVFFGLEWFDPRESRKRALGPGARWLYDQPAVTLIRAVWGHSSWLFSFPVREGGGVQSWGQGTDKHVGNTQRDTFWFSAPRLLAGSHYLVSKKAWHALCSGKVKALHLD